MNNNNFINNIVQGCKNKMYNNCNVININNRNIIISIENYIPITINNIFFNNFNYIIIDLKFNVAYILNKDYIVYSIITIDLIKQMII